MTTWIFFAQTWLHLIMSDITRSVFFFFFCKHCAVVLGIHCMSVVTHVPSSLPKHVVSSVSSHSIEIWYKNVFHSQVNSLCAKAGSVNNHHVPSLSCDSDRRVRCVALLLYPEDSLVYLLMLWGIRKHPVSNA